MAKFMTSRRHQIMQMVCEGKRTKEIAEKLEISPRTVEANYEALKELYSSETLCQAVYAYSRERFTGMFLMAQMNKNIETQVA